MNRPLPTLLCPYCDTGRVRPRFTDGDETDVYVGQECGNDDCGAEWDENGQASARPFEEFDERWCARREHPQVRPLPELYWSTVCVCGKQRGRTRAQRDADPSRGWVDRLMDDWFDEVVLRPVPYFAGLALYSNGIVPDFQMKWV